MGQTLSDVGIRKLIELLEALHVAEVLRSEGEPFVLSRESPLPARSSDPLRGIPKC